MKIFESILAIFLIFCCIGKVYPKTQIEEENERGQSLEYPRGNEISPKQNFSYLKNIWIDTNPFSDDFMSTVPAEEWYIDECWSLFSPGSQTEFDGKSGWIYYTETFAKLLVEKCDPKRIYIFLKVASDFNVLERVLEDTHSELADCMERLSSSQENSIYTDYFRRSLRRNGYSSEMPETKDTLRFDLMIPKTESDLFLYFLLEDFLREHYNPDAAAKIVKHSNYQQIFLTFKYAKTEGRIVELLADCKSAFKEHILNTPPQGKQMVRYADFSLGYFLHFDGLNENFVMPESHPCHDRFSRLLSSRHSRESDEAEKYKHTVEKYKDTKSRLEKATGGVDLLTALKLIKSTDEMDSKTENLLLNLKARLIETMARNYIRFDEQSRIQIKESFSEIFKTKETSQYDKAIAKVLLGEYPLFAKHEAINKIFIDEISKTIADENSDLSYRFDAILVAGWNRIES